MDCTTVRTLASLGPADLPAADAAAVDRHVAGCPACTVVVRERVGDAALRRAMTAVTVPTGLHARLVRFTSAKQSAARWRRAGQWATALAAAVLLAPVSLGVVNLFRPAVDTNGFVIDLDTRWQDPKAATDDWLKAQGLPAELPEDFNYRLLVGRGMEPVQGRAAPVVRFHDDRDEAAVYVLRGSQFDLGSKLTADAQASRFRLKVYRHPTRADVAYLVVYTSDTLDPFLVRRVAPI